MTELNLAKIRKDFPILNTSFGNTPLVYLDNAATTHKSVNVLEAVAQYNKTSNANPHRGAHTLSAQATESFESVRRKVKDFIGANSEREIIFTRGATEAINLVAYSYGMNFIQSGDEILLSISEHHSNLLPWQQVAKAKGAKLVYVYLNDEGQIDLNEVREKITERTKFVAIGHMSNVLGTIHPVHEIIELAHKVGAVVLVDGAQSVPHMQVDVTQLDADFFVFSGHKMTGPMGIGVLYGKEYLLSRMPPFLFGGNMIEYVTEQDSTFASLPYKFEAGTQNVEGVIGLGAAIDYLLGIGMSNIHEYEKMLTEYTLEKLQSLPYVKILGPKTLEKRGGVVSFLIDGVHPHDVGTILDNYGVAVRTGHHCAAPLMKFLNVAATARASVYFYNTKEELDALAEGIKNVRKCFRYGT